MRRQAGFTLIETLVGLALFGLVMAGLSAGTRFVFRIGDIQARLTARTSDLDSVERVLRAAFSQATPGSPDTEALRGGPDQVAWTTTLPGVPGADERKDARLFVAAGRRLVLRWIPHGTAGRADAPPRPSEVELLPGVQRLELSYWEGSWRREWSGPTLPKLIKVRIAFPAGDPRQWPDLVMATVIQPMR